MLKIARFKKKDLKTFKAFGGRYAGRESVVFDTPHCVAGFAEMRSGDEFTVPWHYWNDEVLYIIAGKLKLQWSNPPLFNNRNSVVVSSGNLILVPMGLSLKPRVLGAEPVRLLWISMPRPRHFGTEQFWGTKQT